VKKPMVFLSALLILTALNLYSQEVDTDNINGDIETLSPDFEPDPPPSPNEDRLYVITDFEFDVTGRSRPFALIYNAELKRGEEIRGDANLEEYIREKTQMLINQRVLKDSVVITHTVGEQQPDGAYPVILTIKVEDSWNLIALPMFKYSTNSGLELSIRARDYNFFGTMNPLRINFGYLYDEKERSSFTFEVDTNLPFRAFNLDWNLQFSNLFSYRQKVEEPFYFRNITGLSVELPYEATTFTFGFEESLNLNEENSDRNKLSTGLGEYPDFQSGMYMSSRLYGSWKIPLGIEVSRFGELTYNPGVSVTFNHELPRWELQEIRHGPSLRFNHSLGFEKINWHANHREGLAASLDNSYSYNFYRYKINEEPLSVSFSLTGIGHFIVTSFWGISSRLQYRHWFYHDPDYNESAGDNIRGIVDNSLHADYMLSLNADFPFRVFMFTPSEWFKNDKLRFFNIEFHLAPVIDLALYHNPETDSSRIPKNIAIGGGAELIVFPLFMRNLYIRLSFACNIKELITARPFGIPGGNNRELTFMMGHFY